MACTDHPEDMERMDAPSSAWSWHCLLHRVKHLPLKETSHWHRLQWWNHCPWKEGFKSCLNVALVARQ